MIYNINTTDWESQTYFMLEGPSLTDAAWKAVWKKAVVEASMEMYSDYAGYIDREALVRRAVDVLVDKHGFSFMLGDHTLHFEFAGADLKDIPDLGEYVPTELLPKERRKRRI